MHGAYTSYRLLKRNASLPMRRSQVQCAMPARQRLPIFKTTTTKKISRHLACQAQAKTKAG
ncbi:hypothetical protein L249_2475 [Ophiocordyceps polyrhachis-furcata BCC 54312]|uniref:Uncharacterized protein n=1 Tax=Ophiocordyceps polyrhachis-furcata BCC 54312 TaxID=1330021 RepID=A0A367LPU7_9HYPO|nr:hypothetical protein L249_2475 [Ophiocordyceps polyrhachis-furcata BCC 54312]